MTAEIIAFPRRIPANCGSCRFWSHTWYPVPYGICVVSGQCDWPDPERKTFADNTCDRHQFAEEGRADG